MNKLSLLLYTGSIITLLAGCKPNYQKTGSGLEYRIIPGDKGGPAATTGSTVKLHYTQLMHDTVTTSTVGKMPYYKALIPGTIFAYDPFEVLGQGVREGDSIIVLLRIDSLLSKEKLTKLPPNIRRTDTLFTCIKILRVFPFDLKNTRVADSMIFVDKSMEKHRVDSIQTLAGPKRVEQYLKHNNITAPLTAAGTYLQVIEPGSGIQADSGNRVYLQYKISTLRGKVLDTNMDSSFQHTDVLQFEAGSAYMLKPVDASLRVLQKGAHAKIYIPAMVAQGNGPEKGMDTNYDDIIFEVRVLDVQKK